jgi:histidinol-phosphate aminotransferase
MTAVAAFDFVQKVWPSEANFFLLRVANADEVMQRCAENNVLLRHFGGNLSDCIRITVGSPSDNDQLLRVLGTLTESRDG